jgi:protein-S-isoprenylcysteine O-methyltransferase Ste14
MHWPVPAVGLYLFHALFYAVFIPRLLFRRRFGGGAAPPAGQPGASWQRGEAAGRPAVATAAGTSRLRRRTLVLHALAMGALYYGLAAALLHPRAAAALDGRPLILALRLAGGLTMLGAAALAAWTLAVFRSWRLLARIDPGHELCTAGPFRVVRHPIYLAMDLLALGSWLWAPTAAVALGAVLVAVTGDLRARVEERLLVEVFGDEYERFRGNTCRFIPWLY